MQELHLEQIFYAQQHFRRIKRLADEILCTERERAPLHISGVIGRKHDHRQVWPAAVRRQKLGENFEAVFTAHVQIQEHQVRLELRLDSQGVLRVGGGGDVLITRTLENTREQTDVLLLVVDDQYAGRGYAV